MATGRGQADSIVELVAQQPQYQAEQLEPLTNDPEKQVAIDGGKQCVEDKGGLEVAPNDDFANDDFNEDFDRRKIAIHGVSAQRLTARSRKILCGLAGLTIILGAILGGVLGTRHKNSATVAVTPPQRNIAAVSYTTDSTNHTRVYFQNDVGQIMDATYSGNELTGSINGTGFYGKNGSVIAATVLYRDLSIEISIFYLDVNNLIHDISYSASTGIYTSGTLSAQGYTTMPNSSLSATDDWCSDCANSTMVAFQDEHGFVRIVNYTSGAWILRQSDQSLEPHMGTGLALVDSHPYGYPSIHFINLYYQNKALNVAVTQWDGDRWSLNSHLYGPIPPGAQIAAAAALPDEDFIRVLSLSTTGIEVHVLSGMWSANVNAMVNSTNNKKIYESVAVTAIGNAFAVVKQDGQADAIENWQVAGEATDFRLIGNVNLDGAWG
ncbi:hypothetical protein MMC07_008879 [Pseudocyphellaria aurata]|nr:hypothetical protein [Pseudocyphellaria aurata]